MIIGPTYYNTYVAWYVAWRKKQLNQKLAPDCKYYKQLRKTYNIIIRVNYPYGILHMYNYY